MFQTFGIVRFYNSAKMLSSSPKILAWFLLALPAFAQDECTATGVDFTDGGVYSVDSSSTSKFTFATIFSGGYPWTALLLAHKAVGNAHVHMQDAMAPPIQSSMRPTEETTIHARHWI